MRKLQQKLGLDESASEEEILSSVQEVVNRSNSNTLAYSEKPEAKLNQSETQTSAGDVGHSRVEQIRARVGELCDQHGDEITPKAMFELIINEFTASSGRKD